jgi:hypothetical protein
MASHLPLRHHLKPEKTSESYLAVQFFASKGYFSSFWLQITEWTTKGMKRNR